MRRESATSHRVRLALLRLALAAAATACAPRAGPITGIAPAPGTALPRFAIPAGSRRLDFTWELDDGSMVARGDGVARLAGPDSARVDLFLGGGFGGAAVVLVGDSVRVPPHASGADLIPPPPLLWAALGRLAVPPLPDTVIRLAGDTLRATLGAPVRWRVRAVRDSLRRVARIARGRVVEWVERDGGAVRYELAGRRSLTLRIHRDQPSPSFDASIWRF